MDDYKLYLDKANNFQCKLELEGASLENSHARIILEGKTKKFLFEGTISQKGECEIGLERLGEIFKEGDIGKMRLEVIADDAYFLPWQSDFNIDVSKKLRVEVMSPTKPLAKPAMTVSMVSPAEREFHTLVESVSTKLKKGGITLASVPKNKNLISKLVVESRLGCKYDHNVGQIVAQVVKNLT